MSEGVQVFSLALPGFDIDFDVKKEASLAFTRRFGSHGEDYVFAVADILVKVEQVRHIIVPERHPGNLIELLKDAKSRLRNPMEVKGLEALLPRGHWGRWMHGYWERLMKDSPAADDEVLYERLIPLSLVDGKGGNVVAYRYKGRPTIEVTTRPSPNEPSVYVWAEFEPECLARAVHELQEDISAHIRDAGREG